MKEKRVVGGRELLVCIINTFGNKTKRKGINDLINLQAPNEKTLEKFHMNWRDIMIDMEMYVNHHISNEFTMVNIFHSQITTL